MIPRTASVYFLLSVVVKWMTDDLLALFAFCPSATRISLTVGKYFFIYKLLFFVSLFYHSFHPQLNTVWENVVYCLSRLGSEGSVWVASEVIKCVPSFSCVLHVARFLRARVYARSGRDLLEPSAARAARRRRRQILTKCDVTFLPGSELTKALVLLLKTPK